MPTIVKIFHFAGNRLLSALMAPVLLCLAAAPALAEQSTRVCESRPDKENRRPSDSPTILQPTIDVADIRTECVNGGEQKRGKSRSRVWRKLTQDLSGGCSAVGAQAPTPPSSRAEERVWVSSRFAADNTHRFIPRSAFSADYRGEGVYFRAVVELSAELTLSCGPTHDSRFHASHVYIPANPPTGPPLI